jgi:K+-sensing histidine kinase KdpD
LNTCLIEGEAELIIKCIDEILDNALHFSPVNGSIEINTYNNDQSVVCEISDNGKGFGNDIIDKVFELFVTGDDYNDNKIGIGLPIAKMIMEAHNGSIIIGNNPNGGAFVKLVFQNL